MAVPPPSVPPRPSVTKPGSLEPTPELTSQRHSMFDLTELDAQSLDEDSDSPTQSQENLVEYDNSNQIPSIYPRLSPESDSPFTFPCSEFIDENQSLMSASSDSINRTVDMETKPVANSTPPQKPPRSSLATHSTTNLHEVTTAEQSVSLTTRSPPPLPLRPSKSPCPSPIPTATADRQPTPNGERTYL